MAMVSGVPGRSWETIEDRLLNGSLGLLRLGSQGRHVIRLATCGSWEEENEEKKG